MLQTTAENFPAALIYQSIKQSRNVGIIFSILRLKRKLAPKEVKLLIPGRLGLQLRPSNGLDRAHPHWEGTSAL